jgi:hypothetical protein
MRDGPPRQNCLIWDRMRSRGARLLPMAEFIDPTPLIDERIAAEVAPLREALSHTTDPRHRIRLERRIRRREHRVRLAVLSAPASW